MPPPWSDGWPRPPKRSNSVTASRPIPVPRASSGTGRSAGIPDAALAVHSKRAAEISEAVAEKGFDTYQARQVAARETRKTKRHTAGRGAAAEVAD